MNGVRSTVEARVEPSRAGRHQREPQLDRAPEVAVPTLDVAGYGAHHLARGTSRLMCSSWLSRNFHGGDEGLAMSAKAFSADLPPVGSNDQRDTHREQPE
jgi:hypothetical protein